MLPSKKLILRLRTRRILVFIVEVGQVLRKGSLSPKALSRNGRPKARMRTASAESSIQLLVCMPSESALRTKYATNMTAIIRDAREMARAT